MVKQSNAKIKFIDSFRFMSNSLSSLVNDKSTDCKSYLHYRSTKDNQLIFKCIKCSKKP